MKYTYCERLMWRILAPASLRSLSERGWEISTLKKKAKVVYRQMVARTPDIGGLTGNSLHICLAAGMVWLSIYEAAEGKMSEESPTTRTPPTTSTTNPAIPRKKPEPSGCKSRTVCKYKVKKKFAKK